MPLLLKDGKVIAQLHSYYGPDAFTNDEAGFIPARMADYTYVGGTAGGYTGQLVGGTLTLNPTYLTAKITVSSSAPTDPSVGDIWISF